MSGDRFPARGSRPRAAKAGTASAAAQPPASDSPPAMVVLPLCLRKAAPSCDLAVDFDPYLLPCRRLHLSRHADAEDGVSAVRRFDVDSSVVRRRDLLRDVQAEAEAVLSARSIAAAERIEQLGQLFWRN